MAGGSEGFGHGLVGSGEDVAAGTHGSSNENGLAGQLKYRKEEIK